MVLHLQLATEQLSELQNTSRILHLLHHRNFNQHRRQHWYPSFSTFRSHLNHLIHDITITQSPTSLPSTLLPSRRREIVKICEHKIEKRLGLWRTALVRKWFCSFSQLVGDNQFAVLGLVLLGCLGRACEIVGVTERMVEEGEVTGVELKGFTAGLEIYEVLRGIEDDIGVPILRDENNDLVEVDVKEDEGKGRLKAEAKKRKPQDSPGDVAPQMKIGKTKKRAKKKDAIDDLFSSLF